MSAELPLLLQSCPWGYRQSPKMAMELWSHTLGAEKTWPLGQWWTGPKLLVVAAGGPQPWPYLWAHFWG